MKSHPAEFGDTSTWELGLGYLGARLSTFSSAIEQGSLILGAYDGQASSGTNIYHWLLLYIDQIFSCLIAS